jgi:hypothetical protein
VSELRPDGAVHAIVVTGARMGIGAPSPSGWRETVWPSPRRNEAVLLENCRELRGTVAPVVGDVSERRTQVLAADRASQLAPCQAGSTTPHRHCRRGPRGHAQGDRSWPSRAEGRCDVWHGHRGPADAAAAARVAREHLLDLGASPPTPAISRIEPRRSCRSAAWPRRRRSRRVLAVCPVLGSRADLTTLVARRP